VKPTTEYRRINIFHFSFFNLTKNANKCIYEHQLWKKLVEKKLRMVKDSRLVPVVQAGAVQWVPRQQVNSAHNHLSQSYD